jgi:hypothetical protein
VEDEEASLLSEERFKALIKLAEEDKLTLDALTLEE